MVAASVDAALKQGGGGVGGVGGGSWLFEQTVLVKQVWARLHSGGH